METKKILEQIKELYAQIKKMQTKGEIKTTSADMQYIDLLGEIVTKGEILSSRAGETISIPNKTLSFDLGNELPILTSKFVASKSAILESFWMYKHQSNDVRWLQERKIKIWDGWQCDDKGDYYVNGKLLKSLGKEYAYTIGTAYGWILKKNNQPQRLIETIKTNPQDRRMIISLWEEEYLATACLPSCVWNTMWNVKEGKLNVIVSQRSCDSALGLPFNILQYAVLNTLIAHTTGLKPGNMLWVISDAHIYCNQLEGIKTQFERFIEQKGSPAAPSIWINPEVKDYFDFDSSVDMLDIKIIDYTHNGKISMPVSI